MIVYNHDNDSIQSCYHDILDMSMHCWKKNMSNRSKHDSIDVEGTADV